MVASFFFVFVFFVSSLKTLKNMGRGGTRRKRARDCALTRDGKARVVVHAHDVHGRMMCECVHRNDAM